MKRKSKQQYKQQYEYWTAVIGTKQKTPINWGGSTSSNIVFNPQPPQPTSISGEINQTIQYYAAEGWRLVSTLLVEDEIIIMFERHTEDYALYNGEIGKYLNE